MINLDALSDAVALEADALGRARADREALGSTQDAIDALTKRLLDALTVTPTSDSAL